MINNLRGKRIGQHLYQHVSLTSGNPEEVGALITQAVVIASETTSPDFNVIKIKDDGASVSLLDYAGFFEEGFPILRQYWAVDLETRTCRYRSYEDSPNPPVLHRKELLLSKQHPQYGDFTKLTKAAESLGLFDDSSSIGFYAQWGATLKKTGFYVDGNSLCPVGNVEDDSVPTDEKSSTEIARHRTALSRSSFSAPIQLLERFGFFARGKNLFDYGCGRGDDLRGLNHNGIHAQGWDPYFAPDQPKALADIVNLGFVINVIEDPEERIEALTGAYNLAQDLLVVSVMLKHLDRNNGQAFNDGILTGRGTFQKYFSQEEVLSYIQEVLDLKPIAVAPGIIFVFKNEIEEQRFLSRRGERARTILAPLRRQPVERVPLEQRRRQKLVEEYETHKRLLEPLWDIWAELGRLPERVELENYSEIEEKFGTLNKAAKKIIAFKGEEGVAAIDQSAKLRTEEIALYMAKLQFERKSPYSKLDPDLQRDIKHFYGNYKAASSAGLALLLKVASPADVLEACKAASSAGIGWLDAEDALTLHTRLLDKLPPLLRCYINCGLKLYGDAGTADLIKIHSHSGKLTLMEFDDFDGRRLPRMLSRTKIILRRQSIEFYDYENTYEPPYLYYKSRFINEQYIDYEGQIDFEEKLDSICQELNRGYGPSPSSLAESLRRKRFMIDGNTILRDHFVPDIDDLCGRYLRYRDLIECGETRTRLNISNLPKNPETYTALYDLAANTLDPIIEYFGMIELTYGFCSHELLKKIHKGIAPKLDQHSCYEYNSLGNRICDVGGAAVDFYVKDEDSIEVIDWIVTHVDFDSAYVYGRNLPIHISYSPNLNKKKIYYIDRTGARPMPKKLKITDFFSAS
jgi:DNA phosphorothioation-associated putative methyltransferase